MNHPPTTNDQETIIQALHYTFGLNEWQIVSLSEQHDFTVQMVQTALEIGNTSAGNSLRTHIGWDERRHGEIEGANNSAWLLLMHSGRTDLHSMVAPHTRNIVNCNPVGAYDWFSKNGISHHEVLEHLAQADDNNDRMAF